MKKLFIIILIIVSLIFLSCNNDNNKTQTSNETSKNETTNVTIDDNKTDNTAKELEAITCNEDTAVFKMKDMDIKGTKSLKEYFATMGLEKLEINPNTEIPCTIDFSFLDKDVYQDYIGLLKQRWLVVVNGTGDIRNLQIYDTQNGNVQVGEFGILEDQETGKPLIMGEDAFSFWHVTQSVDPEGHEECNGAKENFLTCSELVKESFNLTEGTFLSTKEIKYTITQ